MCCLDHQDPRVSVGKSTVLPWRQTRRPSGSCLGDKVRSHIQTHVSLDLRESFHPHDNCHSHVTDETFLTFRTSTGMSTSPWQMIPTLFETLSSPPSLVALKLFILIINALTSSFLSSLYRVSVKHVIRPHTKHSDSNTIPLCYFPHSAILPALLRPRLINSHRAPRGVEPHLYS